MLRRSVIFALLLYHSVAAAQARPDPLGSVPALGPLIARSTSELADVINRFSTDRSVLGRRYDAPDSPDQRTRMRALYTAWPARLTEVDFSKLTQEARVDYVLRGPPSTKSCFV